MDYVIKDILKSSFKGKIIVRAHNVETDFYRIEYQNNKSILRFLKYEFSYAREKFMVQNADCVLAITDADKNNFINTYDLDRDKVRVFPVGVNHGNLMQYEMKRYLSVIRHRSLLRRLIEQQRVNMISMILKLRIGQIPVIRMRLIKKNTSRYLNIYK